VDRDEIVRDDFPTARRGYDRRAVAAHLRAIADAVGDRATTPLADAAADKVASIVEAAERKAAEIEADAREEAERIVTTARDEAGQQVERAQGAVSRLVEQADELRLAVGSLGRDMAAEVRERAETPTPEISPEPARVPEPEPPRDPEPTPPRIPEPEPPPSPEPTPPTVPEPQPPEPEGEGGPSTEELIAQLKGDEPAGSKGQGGNGGDTTDGDDADASAARLVAMKMALDGASREDIDRHLAEGYELTDRDKLLDEVFEAVGK
jgi:outer membrane biosynthesis protein TonB